MSALYNLVEIRPLFLRERASSYYRYLDKTTLFHFFIVFLNVSLQPYCLAAISIPLRHGTFEADTNDRCGDHVSTITFTCTHANCTHSTVSTYWMAGLAPEAVHFFKFILILVLYSLCITLFVRLLSLLSVLQGLADLLRSSEFFLRDTVPKRRHRYPPVGFVCFIPDDLRRLLRPSRRYTTCPPMASMALPAEVCVGGAFGQRGWLWLDDRGHLTRRSNQYISELDYEPRTCRLLFCIFLVLTASVCRPEALWLWR